MSNEAPSLTGAVPILVTGKFEETLDFFRRLGFDTRYKDAMYAIMYRDAVELHFSEDKSLDPHDNMHECRIYVRDVDALYRSFPDEAIHPNGKLAVMPWGTREFAVLDPGGLCVKFVEPQTPAS